MFVIMSGGLTVDGQLPDHVIERCEWVIQACNNKYLEKNISILCSSSFTLNVPPKLNQENFILSESSVIYEYLKKRGIKNQILCEQFSHDSVGSVFFSIDLFALPVGAKSVSFVTSSFHSKRVDTIVNLMRSVYPEKIHLETIGVAPNQVFDESISSNSRSIHESDAISKFNVLYKGVHKRSEFLKILLSDHTNYNHLFTGRVCSKDEFY